MDTPDLKKQKKEITYAKKGQVQPSAAEHSVSISRVYRTSGNSEEELEENLVDFWNELSSTYDLLVKDWPHFVQWNGEVIDKVISTRMVPATSAVEKREGVHEAHVLSNSVTASSTGDNQNCFVATHQNNDPHQNVTFEQNCNQNNNTHNKNNNNHNKNDNTHNKNDNTHNKNDNNHNKNDNNHNKNNNTHNKNNNNQNHNIQNNTNHTTSQTINHNFFSSNSEDSGVTQISPQFHLLDCTCGIGTQSLGLAQIQNSDKSDKYVVTGSTVAPKEIERATIEAKKLGISSKLKFTVTDMRKLKEAFQKDSFDVVISCGDAFPHLLHDSDIQEALQNIAHVLKPGGLLLITIRDYDAILKDRQNEDQRLAAQKRPPAKTKITLPRMFDNGVTRRVVYQVWEWDAFQNDKLFHVTHYTTIENLQQGTVSTHNLNVYYRMLTRMEMTKFLENAGFSDIVWMEPLTQTAFYQPVVTAFYHKKTQ